MKKTYEEMLSSWQDMVKDRIHLWKAISIFYEYFERDGGIPTKKEFDKWFYNKEQGDANNYYYQVKRQFLKELEKKGVNIK